MFFRTPAARRRYVELIATAAIYAYLWLRDRRLRRREGLGR